ncbi:hypothetical protein KR018_002013 [Drosophila ironensis]|nr:hypothetical protein KR018_002013 [Drosophila ironensis]
MLVVVVDQVKDELSNVPAPSGKNDAPATEWGKLVEDMVRCVVCNIISLTAIFQCHRGHIICGGCLEIRMHDKLLNEKLSTCTVCHVRISLREPSRNVVALSLVLAMPVLCEHCGARMLRYELADHMEFDCPRRLVACKNSRLGCFWVGEPAGLDAHELQCPVPRKTGRQLLQGLRLRQERLDAGERLASDILAVMQLPDLKMRRLQVLPQGAFPLDIFVKVTRFEAYHHRWAVLLKWQSEEVAAAGAELSEPGCPVFNSLIFQLCLESANECQSTLVISYTFVQGSYSEVSFEPNLHERCEFSQHRALSPPSVFYRHTALHCGKLVKERGIFTRLLMVAA